MQEWSFDNKSKTLTNKVGYTIEVSDGWKIPEISGIIDITKEGDEDKMIIGLEPDTTMVIEEYDDDLDDVDKIWTFSKSKITIK